MLSDTGIAAITTANSLSVVRLKNVKMILEPLEAPGFAVYHTENPQQGLYGDLFRDTLNKRWSIKNDRSSDVKHCCR